MNRPRFSTLIAGALVLVAVLLAATAVLMERAPLTVTNRSRWA